MAWSGSAMFRSYVSDLLASDPAILGSWAPAAAARFLVALFDGTVTPDLTPARAETCYGDGQWTAAREVTSAPAWPAGGVPAGVRLGDDLVEPFVVLWRPGPLRAGPLTITGACGDLLYDPAGPLPGQGIGFHDFGGPVDVATGNLTITWHEPTVPGVPAGTEIVVGFAG